MKTILRMILLVISFVTLIQVSFARDKATSSANREKKDAKEATKKEFPKRLYTEQEFRDAVIEEVKKELTKLGKYKLVDLSAELLKKENDLKLAEFELEKNKEQFEINVREFEKKVQTFEDRQNRLLGCLDGQDKKREKRVGHMVDVIAGMRPAKAAQVLSVQDTVLSVEILGKLDATKVSKIFNLMDKEISARLQKQYMTMKK